MIIEYTQILPLFAQINSEKKGKDRQNYVKMTVMHVQKEPVV